MKWVKRGLIFQPRSEFEWMVTHAAVPVADRVDGNIYRIYFSGRDGYNRSQTAFFVIDMRDPSHIIAVSEKPILRYGGLGCFDESGAMLSWIAENNAQKYLYYIGWNLGVTVPFRNAIGLAISKDGGKTFMKYSEGPILDRNIHDPFFTASCCVMIEHQVWRMWYLSCVKWAQADGRPKHYYNIKYAESSDGIQWTREGTTCIDFQSDEEYAISRPCVIKDGETYKMWYSYRGLSYRIGYAESEDGVHWERKDHEVGIDVSDSGWDSEMIEYPFVFDHNGRRYMLYNGNGYGKTGIGLAVLE